MATLSVPKLHYVDIYGRRSWRDAQGGLHLDEANCVVVPADLIQVGYAWHGGGSSALYSMASCSSIASAKHREALIKEIDTCIAWAMEHNEPFAGAHGRTDLQELQALRGFVATVTFPEDTFDLC